MEVRDNMKTRDQYNQARNDLSVLLTVPVYLYLEKGELNQAQELIISEIGKLTEEFETGPGRPLIGDRIFIQYPESLKIYEHILSPCDPDCKHEICDAFDISSYYLFNICGKCFGRC